MQVCCNDNSGGAYSPLVSTTAGSPASVTFDRVTKVYDNVTALSDFSLDVARVSFLLGPRRSYPPRAHEEIREPDESTHQSHQHRDTL